MKEKVMMLKGLEKKGLRIPLRMALAEEWPRLVRTDRTIPRSFAQLRRLGRTIFRRRHRPAYRLDYKGPFPGAISRLFEESGESLYARFFNGLRSPLLSKAQRRLIEADMEDAIPAFENQLETDHFILRWTNSSAHADDNIADDTIVEETGEFLETAWARLEEAFGRTPYLPEGVDKMEIAFYDGPWWGVASPPEGPIGLNSQVWVDAPGVRRPVSAHELFHKLQYAFGYRTRHTPQGSYKWFSEGMASWAEAFVWQQVSRESKLTDLFDNPDLNLYIASYSALPFWIFFETRQTDTPEDNPVVAFLTEYEEKAPLWPGDPGWDEGYPERLVLREVIDEDWPVNNVYGQLDNFYALFSRERRIGAWRQTPTGGQPYATILNADGDNILPSLHFSEVPIGYGDSYVHDARVSQLGSDYYRFSFADDADGETFNVSVNGTPNGDYSYYLLWEQNGAWKRAAFPSGVVGDYGFSEEIDRSAADSLMLIVSGRGAGGDYTLNASVI